MGLRCVAVSLCLAGFVSRSIPADRRRRCLDIYNYAVGAYRQERWRQAEEAFKKFTDQFPTHPKVPTARLYRGLSLTNLRDYKTAHPVWRDFVKDYPENKNLPVAMYRVAESSYLLNDLKAAETEFQAFLDKYPKNDLAEWALPFLAETQLYLNKPAEAVKTYKIAEAHYPKSRLANDVQLGLARAYEKLKQPDAAIAIYKKLAADETNPQAAQSQMNLATLYFEGRDTPKPPRLMPRWNKNFPKASWFPPPSSTPAMRGMKQGITAKPSRSSTSPPRRNPRPNSRAIGKACPTNRWANTSRRRAF